MNSLPNNQNPSPPPEASLTNTPLPKDFPPNQILISEQHLDIIGIDKRKYSLSISLKENSIFFSVKDKNEIISGRIYRLELSLEDFYKKDRYFMIYENLKEIFEYFIEMEKSSILIYTEDDNQTLIIKIKNEICKKKIKEVIFILLPNEVKIEQIVQNLCEKIREIDELKLNIEILKNIVEFHNKLLVGVNNNTFQKIYQQFKKESKIILNDENDLKLIMSAVKKQTGIGFIEIKKLFDTGIDGDSVAKFHEKCDDKINTLTLIKSKNGRRFGGFTSVSWDMRRSYKYDKRSFLFSLDNKEVYYIKDGNEKYAIWGGPEDGPSFGYGCDILLKNGCKNNNGSYDSHECGHEYSYETYGKKFVYNGERFFQVSDYEVYQLIFY